MDASDSRNRTRGDLIGMIACLLIALVPRLVVIASQWHQLEIDRDAYLGIASSLVDGRGYSTPNGTSPTAFRAPLYPVLLAIGFICCPKPVVVASINLAAGLLTVWLTACLGARLNLGRLRFLAAILVAIDPLLLRYSSQAMTESLCTLIAACWLLSAVPAGFGTTSLSPWRGLFSGLSFGLLVLCRPTFWLLAGLCGCYWFACWLRQRSNINPQSHECRLDIAAVSWSCLGVTIAVLPWLIRNLIVFGVPILTTTHGGYTLLLANNPTFHDEVVTQPWGAVWQEASLLKWQADLDHRMELELGPTASEVERDRWQSKQAQRFIVDHPRFFGQAMIHRIRSLWNTVPQGEETDGAKGIVLATVGWFYTIVLITAAIGIFGVVIRKDFEIWLPLLGLVICIQVVHLVYWTNTRMRAPLTPAIALFAVATLGQRRNSILSDKN